MYHIKGEEENVEDGFTTENIGQCYMLVYNISRHSAIYRMLNRRQRQVYWLTVYTLFRISSILWSDYTAPNIARHTNCTKIAQ